MRRPLETAETAREALIVALRTRPLDPARVAQCADDLRRWGDGDGVISQWYRVGPILEALCDALEPNGCDNPRCPGWVHVDDEKYTVERCDDCRRYESDAAARDAHNEVCGCDRSSR